MRIRIARLRIRWMVCSIFVVRSFDYAISDLPLVTVQGPIELLELVHLDSETGEIVVAGKIDRERYAWINLTARAFDGGSPNKTGSAPVFIQVRIIILLFQY